MKTFLKSNFVSVCLLIGSGILFIYNIYDNFHKPVIDTKIIDNTLKIDSLKSVLEQEYRYKIDSVSYIYNKKIYNIQKENKRLNEEIKNLDTDIGDLPAFY